MSSLFIKKQNHAIEEELDSLEDYSTWEFLSQKNDKKAIKLKYIIKRMIISNGFIKYFKALGYKFFL